MLDFIEREAGFNKTPNAVLINAIWDFIKTDFHFNKTFFKTVGVGGIKANWPRNEAPAIGPEAPNGGPGFGPGFGPECGPKLGPKGIPKTCTENCAQ